MFSETKKYKNNDHFFFKKINITPYQLSQQDFFESRMMIESVDALDIYWFVTIDKKNNDLPEYVEGLLMQRHYEIYGNLPLWNR
jgi:hypothetical protein